MCTRCLLKHHRPLACQSSIIRQALTWQFTRLIAKQAQQRYEPGLTPSPCDLVAQLETHCATLHGLPSGLRPAVQAAVQALPLPGPAVEDRLAEVASTSLLHAIARSGTIGHLAPLLTRQLPPSEGGGEAAMSGTAPTRHYRDRFAAWYLATCLIAVGGHLEAVERLFLALYALTMAAPIMPPHLPANETASQRLGRWWELEGQARVAGQPATAAFDAVEALLWQNLSHRLGFPPPGTGARSNDWLLLDAVDWAFDDLVLQLDRVTGSDLRLVRVRAVIEPQSCPREWQTFAQACPSGLASAASRQLRALLPTLRFGQEITLDCCGQRAIVRSFMNVLRYAS